MTKTKVFYGVYREAGTNATQLMTTTSYTNKTKFAEDLRANGFKVKAVVDQKEEKRINSKALVEGFWNLSEKEEMIFNVLNS